ncbi:class I SAM-dependent rRNA methyltransferase, partial [Candidatus Dependentiae bacterium]|nr:class I SAM-dependent rRNA methyltransferase [Candidatus Dependentiae bacterium]
DYMHPWIYQKSCLNINSEFNTGDFVFVSYKNKINAAGFLDKNSLYALKIFEFNVEPEKFDVKACLKNKILKAVSYRNSIGYNKVCRIVHGEADGIPGLFIERYENLIVIQYSFKGIYNFSNLITEIIIELFDDISIFIISPDNEKKIIYGNIKLPVKIEIDNVKFYINPDGQKTGFYLDQRINRINLSNYVRKGMRILDSFAYTGGFALYCMRRGAVADIIEYNKRYVDQFEQNCELNGFMQSQYKCYIGRTEEIFKRLDSKYDIIFIDPPGLVSKSNQKNNALKYIYNLFIDAISLLNSEGIISLSVCSNILTDDSLNRTIMNACAAKKERFRIIYENRSSSDHPVLLNFPEGDYLRCLAFQKV